MTTTPIPSRIQLLRMKAVLRTQHLGPGPHPGGSPQSVHGGESGTIDVEALDDQLSIISKEVEPWDNDLENAWVSPSGKIFEVSSNGHMMSARIALENEGFDVDAHRPGEGLFRPSVRGVVQRELRDYGYARVKVHSFESDFDVQVPLKKGTERALKEILEFQNVQSLVWTIHDKSNELIDSGSGISQFWRSAQNPGVRRNSLARMRLVLSHGGPGPHKDGSPQSVHGGGKGAGSTSTSTTAKAGGKGASKIKKSGKFSWRDPDGKTHDSDVYLIDKFGALPSSGMGAIGVRGPGKGSIVFTPETMPSHGQAIRAFYSGNDVQDDFVRFYFKGDHLEFSVVSAGEVVDNSNWADRGVDNIYKSLDRLSAAGVPAGTKIKVKGGKHAFDTTI